MIVIVKMCNWVGSSFSILTLLLVFESFKKLSKIFLWYSEEFGVIISIQMNIQCVSLQQRLKKNHTRFRATNN